MRHPLLLLSLLPLLLGTSCSLLISFFIANVSSRPIHIEYPVPCRPDYPSPTLIGVRTLKHDGLSGTIHGDRPAPARVQGRVDSLITYSLDLLPDTAIRIFDGSADFGGTVRKGEIRFWGVRITVDTGQAAHSYEGMALVDVFRKWHKLVHVLEVQ